MRPQPRSRIGGRNAWVTRHVPNVFVCQACSTCSDVGVPRGLIAALLINTSTPSGASASRASATLDGSATSICTGVIPGRSSPLAATAPASTSREPRNTSIPNSASILTTASRSLGCLR